MSSRQAIMRVVLKRPGLQLREIAKALGFDDRAKIAALSVQLTYLAKDKRVRHDGAVRGRKYFPTPKTQAAIDVTQAAKKPAPRPVTPAPAKQYASPLARKPKAESKIRIGTPKPTAAQQFQVVPKKPDVTAAAPPRTTRETVEEFQARGGRIEHLSNGASAEPLRIARADIDAANWRRREQKNASQ